MIITFYNDKINPQGVINQKKVFEHFNIESRFNNVDMFINKYNEVLNNNG